MADRFRILEKERERKKRMIRFLFFFLADLFDFGRNVVGSNVWFPNSYFFGCGRDVHAAACIFEQKPAKTVHEFFIEQSYLFLPTAGYAMEHRREGFTAEDQETVLKF